MNEVLEWLGGFSSGDSHLVIAARESKKSRLGYRLVLKVGWSQNGIPHASGFWDADGAFMVRVAKESTYKIGYVMNPIIRGTSTDDVLISHIKEVLINNGIEIKESIEHTKKGKPDFRLAITNISEVKQICKLLLPYLVGRKQIQADIMLNKIIPLFEQKRHLTREGFIEIMEWREIMALSKKVPREKYSTQFFRDLWNLQKGI